MKFSEARKVIDMINEACASHPQDASKYTNRVLDMVDDAASTVKKEEPVKAAATAKSSGKK